MIHDIIDRIRYELLAAFEDLDYWFGNAEEELNYSPSSGGWRIRQILEHISLTNHFLLILVKKGAMKSVEIAGKTEYKNLLPGYDLDWKRLKIIGEHRSFEWNRPEHMEPKNEISLGGIKR